VDFRGGGKKRRRKFLFTPQTLRTTPGAVEDKVHRGELEGGKGGRMEGGQEREKEEEEGGL